MPELPEVETTIRGLRKKIIGKTITDVWSDFLKMVKKPKNFDQFKREIIGKKIQDVRRRGKNILIDLSSQKILLIHQKLTGHLLYGKWKQEKGKWVAPSGPLSEKFNTFIHFLFRLDNDWMLVLSDLRKFAKIELWDAKELENSEEMKNLGPEPLSKSFTFEKFQNVLPKKGKIKQVLINQKIIVGIGNIYSDEILFEARINPFRDVSKLDKEELKRIHQAIPKILKKAIELGGESIIDWRNTEGGLGGFDKFRRVYRKQGEKCLRCGEIIQRKKIGQRSAHFCPICQK